MATVERRLEALEQAAPIRRHLGVHDASELSSLELALYLIEHLPEHYSWAAEDLGIDLEVFNEIGDLWAEDATVRHLLTEPLERFVASLFCELLRNGGSPLLIERFRKAYPPRI